MFMKLLTLKKLVFIYGQAPRSKDPIVELLHLDLAACPETHIKLQLNTPLLDCKMLKNKKFLGKITEQFIRVKSKPLIAPVSDDQPAEQPATSQNK